MTSNRLPTSLWPPPTPDALFVNLTAVTNWIVYSVFVRLDYVNLCCKLINHIHFSLFGNTG